MTRFGLLLALALTGVAPPATGAEPACAFAVSGHVTKLYSGALSERITLRASTLECAAAVTTAVQVRLVNGGSELRATAHAASAGEVDIELGEIPTTLVVGAHDWLINDERERAPDKPLGKVRLESTEPAAAVTTDSDGNPRLSVRYGVPELDVWHSQIASSGIAVVSDQKAAPIGYILNEAEVRIVPELRRAAQVIADARTPSAERCNTLFKEADCKWSDDPPGPNESACARRIHDKRPDDHCRQRWKCASVLSEEIKSCIAVKLEEKVSECEARIERGDEGLINDDENARLDVWRHISSPWRVRVGWAKDLSLYEKGWWYSADAPQRDPSLLRFAVFAAHTEGVSAVLELKDADRILIRTQFLLAKAARSESLPLPIARAMDVQCGASDIVENNETRAVDDKAIENGLCVVRYSASDMLASMGSETLATLDSVKETYKESCEAERAESAAKEAARKAASPSATAKEKKAAAAASDKADRANADLATKYAELRRALLAMYGQQQVDVTVSRGGAAQKTITHWFDPASDTKIPLPPFTEGTGLVAVSVRVQGPSTPGVLYRAGPRQQAATSAPVADLGNLEFRANLRPRGHLGWSSGSIRTFVTFPVRFTGLRVPAKASELQSSSDNTAVQVSKVEAGMMFALEPWDYDTDRSLWVLPVRFMAGLHLFDLSNGRVAPALLAGASFTFPILQPPGGTSNLGADVAIGAFWEVDLEKRYPFKDGNHFLLTLGLDVLTLFAK